MSLAHSFSTVFLNNHYQHQSSIYCSYLDLFALSDSFDSISMPSNMSSNEQVVKDPPPPYPDLELGQLPPEDHREVRREATSSPKQRQSGRCAGCCPLFGILIALVVILAISLIIYFCVDDEGWMTVTIYFDSG
jgi:hypothetical protein